MADNTKCPSCSNTESEAINETPVNPNCELIFVRCTSCKAVADVIDHSHTKALVKKLAA